MSSPLPPDPYQILGVSKDAQIPEIRSAHRKLVLKCHPDKVQDPALKAVKQDEFQKVQQAYEILSDEKERQKYDDQVKLQELRKQAYAKANSSAQRSSRAATAEFEIHQTAPRAAHRSSPSSGTPPTFKVYYSKSWDSDDARRGPRVYETGETRPSPRREGSYAERDSRPSKRESEREREREKDRERERDRERRKRADRQARDEREAKEARRAEKKAREKQEAKEMKRAAEEKRRAYVTPPPEDEAPPRMEKRSSSSRKHDSTRDSPLERERQDEFDDPRFHYAAAYINAAKAGAGPQRSKTYHGRTPYVPSPPPAPGVASAYPSPDEEEVRRSSAPRVRRGSADVPKVPREKAYSKPSRERLDEEPIIREAAPRAAFSKSTSAAAGMSTSPPRPIPRTNTMPAEPSFSRPTPGVTRAATFSEGAMPRGRGRSRMDPQADIAESDDEDDYDYERDRRARERERERERESRGDRKHRSSKKHRSPDRAREETRSTNVYTYERDEEGGAPKTKLQRSYTRRLDPEPDLYESYGSSARYVDARPALHVRESSYSGYPTTSTKTFPKVRTTRMYTPEDVQYTQYPGTAYAA